MAQTWNTPIDDVISTVQTHANGILGLSEQNLVKLLPWSNRNDKFGDFFGSLVDS